jgi:hypothetical protein
MVLLNLKSSKCVATQITRVVEEVGVPQTMSNTSFIFLPIQQVY